MELTGNNVRELLSYDPESGAMKWERVYPSVFWPKANAEIIADRHLPDGTRQHMILGKTPDVRIVDNAEVVGQDAAPDAEYSSTPSHLSGWRATLQ